MKLYYFKDDFHNFGDDLNAWLWPKLLPSILDDDEEHLLLGIGTILNDKLPKAKYYTVLGSGFGYGERPKIDKNWQFISVRGKDTCKELMLDDSLAVIDPAYLLSDYFTEEVEKKYQCSIIPHAQSLELANWQGIADQLGLHLIDPRTTDIQFFVSEIRSSELILTEAMHGAIIADCFAVPWCGYKAYDYINEKKWNDWLSPLNKTVTLSKITSLYQGYQKHSLSFMIKNEIKHLLKRFNIWNNKWSEPIRKKSSSKDIEMIKKQLSHLKNNKTMYSYSSRKQVETQLNLLRDKISSFVKNHKNK